MQLLVLGTEEDPHVRRTLSELQKLGVSAVVLDNGREINFSIDYDKKFRHGLTISGENLGGQFAVWPRVKMSAAMHYAEKQRSPDETQLDVRQRRAVWDQNWRWTYLAFVLNHEGRVFNRAGLYELPKIHQQKVASDCGLLAPPSLTTTSLASIKEFMARHGEVITKAMGPSRIPQSLEDADVCLPVMTTQVFPTDVDEYPEQSFAFCPNFFQKEIKKSHELRVFACGSAIAAFKINSQSHRLTRVDWRYGNAFLSFDPTEISEATRNGIARYLKAMQLDYGSFDFAVDLEGREWFLECNADGQWAWLETDEAPVVSGLLARHFASEIGN